MLLEDGHAGATYELASRVATVAELAAEAGVTAERVDDPGTHPWLSAMFAYYDRHGLPVGTLPLRARLLGASSLLLLVGSWGISQPRNASWLRVWR